MSWAKLKTKRGVLKLKPRWQMRWAERQRLVKVYDLGLLVVSWWPDEYPARSGRYMSRGETSLPLSHGHVPPGAR